MSIKNSLKNIYENENVSAKQLSEVFSGMLSGKLSAVQISAVLMALKYRGESAEMIMGAASSLLKAAIPFEVASDLNVVDCCGTGGDGKGLLNISTTVSFVAAACGLKVVKHGNRAVSSNSGSADVLEHLGIAPMDNVDILKQQLTGIGLTFLFAPYFHPALKQVMPVRKELATRTLFNVLGPIINPARPRIQLMGVYDKTLCRPVAETLQYLGCEHALVVHGSGLD
ncbi:MAG TPA: anthranilate phosphoribosyltransferase, partial [Aeromonadales bacterium]|nr:anthranilate phosphoribosyltransferase [Aeromonadales bacterium]